MRHFNRRFDPAGWLADWQQTGFTRMSAVAFTLQGANLQLATIQVPVLTAGQGHGQWLDYEEQQQEDVLPRPLHPASARLSASLRAVRALSSPAAPFAAHVWGEGQLRVVTLKPHVAAVFKLLHSKQASLGVEIKNVKSHVSLAKLEGPELEQACTSALLASLLPCGWWQLSEQQVLGASLLAPAEDGWAQACGSLTLQVHVLPGSTKLLLLIKPEQVEFRHPACNPAASLNQLSSRLSGSMCQLLPDFRQALIHRLRPADEPTLQRLRPLWESYGMPLPQAVSCLVDVCLDCDPDAPTYPYPSTCVLGKDGLGEVADKPSAPAVQAALVKLRDNLVATPLKILGDKLQVAEAREWFPDGLPVQRRAQQESAAATEPTFKTARQWESMGRADASGGAWKPVLGQQIDLSGPLGAQGAGTDGAVAGSTWQPRQRRRHAVADAGLQAFFEEAKLQLAQAERPATLKTAGATGASAAPAGGSQPAASKQPSVLQRATAAAAAGVASRRPALPTFQKFGTVAAAAAAAAAKKAAAPAQKRTGPDTKPPAAPKRPKPAPGSAAAPQMPGSAAAALGPAGSGAPPTSAAAPGTAAAPAGGPATAAHAKAASKARMPASTAVGAAGGIQDVAGSSAPPKAPAKPRAKAADIDVVTVTAKVQQSCAAGTLSKLTIPELKAYLKSMKQPVGGKKGELEERVRQLMGGMVAAGTGAGAAAAPVPTAAG